MQDADESADAFIAKKLKGYLSDPSPPPSMPKLFHSLGEGMEPSPRDLPSAATLSSPHSPHPVSESLNRGPSGLNTSVASVPSSEASRNVVAPNLLVPQNFLQQILQNTLAQMGVGKDGKFFSMQKRIFLSHLQFRNNVGRYFSKCARYIPSFERP